MGGDGECEVIAGDVACPILDLEKHLVSVLKADRGALNVN